MNILDTLKGVIGYRKYKRLHDQLEIALTNLQEARLPETEMSVFIERLDKAFDLAGQHDTAILGLKDKAPDQVRLVLQSMTKNVVMMINSYAVLAEQGEITKKYALDQIDRAIVLLHANNNLPENRVLIDEIRFNIGLPLIGAFARAGETFGPEFGDKPNSFKIAARMQTFALMFDKEGRNDPRRLRVALDVVDLFKLAAETGEMSLGDALKGAFNAAQMCLPSIDNLQQVSAIQTSGITVYDLSRAIKPEDIKFDANDPFNLPYLLSQKGQQDPLFTAPNAFGA